MRTRIYVAGPITVGNQAVNVRRAVDACEELFQLGYAPYCPHLSFFWEYVAPHSHAEWLDYDFSWLFVCDAVLRLPGESKGADQEVEYAKRNGIPVFNSIQDLAPEVSMHQGTAQRGQLYPRI